MENRPSDLEMMRCEEQRLALLRWLHVMPTYTGNEELAERYLAAVGLVAAHADLRERLLELEREELVALRIGCGVTVITLTQRGSDAAQGLAIVEGVRKPGPDCPY